jgi:hypothetical protein
LAALVGTGLSVFAVAAIGSARSTAISCAVPCVPVGFGHKTPAFRQSFFSSCATPATLPLGVQGPCLIPHLFHARLPAAVFSGVQPTGNLHLGNYLGAIVRFVELQDRYDCIYCVVDLHAMTAGHDPAELAGSTREVAAAFIAAGIDPAKHIVFNQSRVHEHAELAWIFNCVARMGWLNRMTQFKEKAGKDRENASAGLFTYPVLMAADILAYRGHPCAGR